MKQSSPQVIIAALAVVLLLVLSVSAVTNKNFLSGQLFQYIGEKIGVVQLDEAPQQVADEALAGALQLPIPADEDDLPVGLQDRFPLAVNLSTDTADWGSGELIVSGASVTPRLGAVSEE